MAEKSTVARPYAQAVFELAAKQQKLPQWSEMLGFVALVVSDQNMKGLIGNPRVEKSRLVELLQGICKDRLDQNGMSLIKVLVEAGRLGLLPEIALLYEGYRAEAEKTVEAEVVSAFPVSTEQQKKIADALKARLGREVSLQCTTDKSLVGGAIIRAGDMVIDGSVTGQLAKLTSTLSR